MPELAIGNEVDDWDFETEIFVPILLVHLVLKIVSISEPANDRANFICRADLDVFMQKALDLNEDDLLNKTFWDLTL